MDEKRAWEEIQYAKKTGKLMKELAELSGFTVSGAEGTTHQTTSIWRVYGVIGGVTF